MSKPSDLLIDPTDADVHPASDEVLERVSSEILEGNRRGFSTEGDSENIAVDEDDQVTVEAAEITCDQCKTTEPWQGASFCPACGFYPTLNRTVNIEDAGGWEITEEEPKNLLQVIPRWAWELLVGVLVIVGVSLFAMLTNLPGSPTRAWWAVAQVAVGEIVFCIVHIRVFFYATVKSDRFSPVAWFLNPVAIWKPTMNNLPATAWRLKLAAWGQVAALCAVVLIGGLDYSGLFKEGWGVKSNANKGLLQAIANKEEKEGGADNLNDALTDFTGEAVEEEPEAKLPRADCVVFGYTQLSKNSFEELLLASKVENQLKFVGRIHARDLSVEAYEKINSQIQQVKPRRKPFVRTVHSGTWIEPRIMMEVEYEELSSSDQFVKLKFYSLLNLRE